MKYYWAYAVDRENKATLVYTDSKDAAEWEREMMRHSDAKRIGSVTGKKITELGMRMLFHRIGVTVEHVRPVGEMVT